MRVDALEEPEFEEVCIVNMIGIAGRSSNWYPANTGNHAGDSKPTRNGLVVFGTVQSEAQRQKLTTQSRLAILCR